MTWVKKKIGPGIYNLTTVWEAEQVLTAGSKVVLGFLDSLVVFPQYQLGTSICNYGIVIRLTSI